METYTCTPDCGCNLCSLITLSMRLCADKLICVRFRWLLNAYFFCGNVDTFRISFVGRRWMCDASMSSKEHTRNLHTEIAELAVVCSQAAGYDIGSTARSRHQEIELQGSIGDGRSLGFARCCGVAIDTNNN